MNGFSCKRDKKNGRNKFFGAVGEEEIRLLLIFLEEGHPVSLGEVA